MIDPDRQYQTNHSCTYKMQSTVSSKLKARNSVYRRDGTASDCWKREAHLGIKIHVSLCLWFSCLSSVKLLLNFCSFSSRFFWTITESVFSSEALINAKTTERIVFWKIFQITPLALKPDENCQFLRKKWEYRISRQYFLFVCADATSVENAGHRNVLLIPKYHKEVEVRNRAQVKAMCLVWQDWRCEFYIILFCRIKLGRNR